jgi:hypothetical protein
VTELTEVETGKKRDRPLLAKALVIRFAGTLLSPPPRQLSA